jgi:sugar phosphate permease
VATLIHDTYLPLYLQEVLGLSNTKTGNLYAISQFLCNASKSLSGTLADFLSPSRMIIFGTLLTTINKPMFAMSGYVYATFGTVACLYWVTAGKVFDRMSKGVREAPGKALIGDLAQEAGDKTEGAFSLRQAMGTAGALLGSGIAGLAYTLSGRNYIATFALSAVPALAAFILVATAFGSKAKEQDAANKQKRKDAADKGQAEGTKSLNLGEKIKIFIKCLQPAYWQALVVVCLLYFARFDASFITLRARMVMNKAQLPLLTSTMMLTTAVLATPCGLRAKRSIQARNNMLLAGFGVMVLANLSFAFISNAAGMFLGAGLVGAHMAMTHGILLSMISSYIPAGEVPGLGRISGTVWSFTDFVLGIVLAYSNSVAGKLADLTLQAGYGNIGCFLGGMVATTVSGLVLLICGKFLDLGKEELITKKKPRAA